MSTENDVLTLEKLRFGLEQRIGKYQLMQYVDSIQIEDIAEYFAIRIRGFVFGERSEKKETLETIKVPDGWWQAFKAEKFPSWLLSKHPVKYKQITTVLNTTTYNVYPGLKIASDINKYRIPRVDVRDYYDPTPRR